MLTPLFRHDAITGLGSPFEYGIGAVGVGDVDGAVVDLDAGGAHADKGGVGAAAEIKRLRDVFYEPAPNECVSPNDNIHQVRGED